MLINGFGIGHFGDDLDQTLGGASQAVRIPRTRWDLSHPEQPGQGVEPIRQAEGRLELLGTIRTFEQDTRQDLFSELERAASVARASPRTKAAASRKPVASRERAPPNSPHSAPSTTTYPPRSTPFSSVRRSENAAH